MHSPGFITPARRFRRTSDHLSAPKIPFVTGVKNNSAPTPPGCSNPDGRNLTGSAQEGGGWGGSVAAVCGASKAWLLIGRARGSKADGVDSHQLEPGDNVSLFRYLDLTNCSAKSGDHVAAEASPVLRAHHPRHP